MLACIKMYFIIRKHSAPHGAKKRIFRKYINEFEQSEILMSEWDMNFWIRKNISLRSSVIHQHRFVFEMSFDQYVNSIKHNSMVEQWLIKKKSNHIDIVYKKTRKKTRCCICLESSGLFVEIDPCKCIFHLQCIKTSTKYSNMCPLCNKPIKEHATQTNVKKEKTE